MLSILFYIFITIIFVQLFYYLVVFGKFAFAKNKPSNPQKEAVSVIVCAKNEADNVLKLIPLLAEQNYPDFEIVLIDDASSDATLDIFEDFEKRYSNIKIVKVVNNEAFWGNKKFALTLGIKASKNKNLLFIDADCYPVSTNWITEMSIHFNTQKSIVLGYGAYEKMPYSFLNKIIRFETLITAVQYFSWAKLGKPYMGVGRNLAYDRALFFEVDGYRDHMKIRSGDDDLFINQVANKSNTAICFSPESFTYSKPKTKYSQWFTQKRRHVSTAQYYKTFDKLQLTLFYISQILFLILPTILLAFEFEWQIVLGLIGFRYFFSWTILHIASKKLNEKDVMVWFPVIEIILIFTQLNVFITNIFSKPVYWK